ncbi:NAD(P)-dependent oxidoreductase [Roseibium sp. HPY-6]|uniref:NAD-dependent epimerase/dehydratase family protein n=1 Tax=Roseibium sp. HPY-6 TaxID=3229852 RepID=UPI00338D6EF6
MGGSEGILMHVLITGAGGTVGRFLTERMLFDDHRVTSLGRKPIEDLPVGFAPFDLTDREPQLPTADALIHCALYHEPGKFRGGEGHDPERFWRLNVEGTAALFQAAKRSGCRSAVFLSSRAVYGDQRRGETLLETDPPAPDTLYGKVKLAGEKHLEGLCDAGFSGAAMRATGVYGIPPGMGRHKWTDLFASFLSGAEIAPRCATEVHGEDLASALLLVLKHLEAARGFEAFNVSDLVLDRAELLQLFVDASGTDGSLPAKSASLPGVMDTDKLRRLGWAPGGMAKLNSFLEDCCA